MIYLKRKYTLSITSLGNFYEMETEEDFEVILNFFLWVTM